MSLQVWLPLNGDLRNQGLSDLSFSGEERFVTVDNNGKIGKCYHNSGFYNNGFTAGGLVSDKEINLGQNQSMFCWFKFQTLNSQSSLGAGLVSQHRYASNQGMGITIKYVSATTGYLSVNTGNGTGRTYNVHCGTTLLQAETWYHGGYTYDGSTIKIYVNGILEGTYTMPNMKIVSDYLTVFCWSLNGTTGNVIHGNYKLNGYLNDVRIYDHTLSPREVKELSKGLVLHMPLAAPGGENMVKNSNFSQDFINWQNPNNNFDIVEKDGYRCVHVSGGMNATKYIRQDIISYIDTSNLDQTYIVSADIYAENIVKGTSNYFLNPFYFGGSYNKNGSSSWLGATFINPTDGENQKVFYNNQGKGWVHVKALIKFDQVPLSMYYYPYARDFTGDIYIKNIKIEKGSIATPWTPNPADPEYTAMGFNDGIEYDVSGYGHNGTKGGTTYSSDTARYNASISFDGIDDLVLLQNFDITNIINNQCTISFWIKPNGENGARSVYFGAYSAVTWSIEKTTSNKLRLYWNADPDLVTNLSIVDGQWQHIAITKNGLNDLKVYLNGILIQSLTTNHPNKTFSTTWRIGKDVRTNDGTPYKGLMSDFRIYATALSAEDVLALYNTPESLTNTGTLLTQGEFTEVE